MSVPIGLIAITGRQKAIPEGESLPPPSTTAPRTRPRNPDQFPPQCCLSLSFLCSCMTPISRRGTFFSSSSAAALHTDGQRKKTLFLPPHNKDDPPRYDCGRKSWAGVRLLGSDVCVLVQLYCCNITYVWGQESSPPLKRKKKIRGMEEGA